MKLILLMICSILIIGCATLSDFVKLQVGMTKAEVTATIGDPTVARGAITNKYGQVIEVWQYDRFVSAWNWEQESMWVFFCDGRLSQYGQAGDWSTQPDKIYEMRFR